MQMIHEKNYLQDMELIVNPYLNERKTEGYFEGYDGNKLRYFHYKADNEIGAIVICHGFTESCEKYDEMSYYFLQNGYSVFVHDHRGHGLSYRCVEDKTITHIDNFYEYIRDFKVYINTVVRKKCDKPLYLYAHSMGGAISMIYMLQNKGVFKKAILSSPMIVPASVGIPPFMAAFIMKTFILRGLAKERAFISEEYPGYSTFEESCDTSEVRFQYYENKRESEPYLTNHSPSYKWVYEALRVGGKILTHKNISRLTIPVYIFSANDDTVVKREPQRKLSEKLTNSMFITVSNAKHEIYMSTDDVMEKYLDCIFTFLK